MSATTLETRHAGYTVSQILLHWVIAALVIWQLVFGESLPEAERLIDRGGTPDAATAFFATTHIWAGFAILALVVLRVLLRLANGAPEPGHGAAAMVARATHLLFYLLLFLVPLTGIADYYFGWPTGEIHELGKPAFIVLIALHAAAALWHQFVQRDGTLTRMVVPAP